MRKINRFNGITLIALVITIVVLLILAGITIATLTGDNGLLTKVGQAKNVTELAGEKENIELAIITAMSGSKYGNIDEENLRSALPKDSNVKKLGKNYLVTLKNGNQYRIYSNGDVKLYDYELMESTSVFGKLDNDGTLYLRATDPGGYRTYTNSGSITTDWNTTLPASKDAVLKVIIEEPIAPTTAAEFFSGFKNLTTIEKIENLHTENVTSMNSMFGACKKLKELDLSWIDTKSVIDMSYMFGSCNSIKCLDLSNFNTSSVTNMAAMFAWTVGNFESIDVSEFDTSNVTSMSEMFRGCKGLKELDVSNFNTSKVTNMGSMFCDCNSLSYLDVSRWNTENVTNMGCLFFGCKNVKKIDVSNFNTDKVTDMNSMFGGCESISSLDVSKFNTSKVTSMAGMFSGINLVKLDFSNFTTNNVKSMAYMFYNCKRLTEIDFSGFNTEKLENTEAMFQGATGLKSIDLSDFNSLKVTSYPRMFQGVTAAIKLGPNWNSSITANNTGYAGTAWNI